MSAWIDHKYINLLSSHLEQFKRKDRHLYNFRCPVCGDSQKNLYKARGYVMERENKLSFYCHNCSTSMSAYDFIKYVNPMIHKEYVMETYKDKNESRQVFDFKPDITKFKKPKYQTTTLKGLKKISQLHHDHKAKKYIVSRKIPNYYHSKIFYTKEFLHWVNSLVPNKFDVKALALDEPRIVIPFLDKENNIFGFQGRSVRSASSLRYITIMLDESKPKIFGLDTVDFGKTVYIMEGPIDSMFVTNSLAMAGSDASVRDFPACRTVYVYDNEPRNVEIIKKIEKQIKAKHPVFIWPDNVKHKDINDCALNGMSRNEIKSMINDNIFEDLSATFRLTDWKR